MPLDDLTTRARELRQQMTDAERLLWSRLRRRFLGTKFREGEPADFRGEGEE
jgi:BirA family biotin operon repressor/biotin-[acetyl-CoA-carboxylase] ligase